MLRIAALSSVGLPSDRFSFEGFLSSKQTQRLASLEKLKDETQTLIFYEAPHRILDSVSDMAKASLVLTALSVLLVKLPKPLKPSRR